MKNIHTNFYYVSKFLSKTLKLKLIYSHFIYINNKTNEIVIQILHNLNPRGQNAAEGLRITNNPYQASKSKNAKS